MQKPAQLLLWRFVHDGENLTQPSSQFFVESWEIRRFQRHLDEVAL